MLPVTLLSITNQVLIKKNGGIHSLKMILVLIYIHITSHFDVEKQADPQRSLIIMNYVVYVCSQMQILFGYTGYISSLKIWYLEYLQLFKQHLLHGVCVFVVDRDNFQHR